MMPPIEKVNAETDIDNDASDNMMMFYIPFAKVLTKLNM